MAIQGGFMKIPGCRASHLCCLLIMLADGFNAQAAVAAAMPVNDPASLLGILLCVMVGGGAAAMRRGRP